MCVCVSVMCVIGIYNRTLVAKLNTPAAGTGEHDNDDDGARCEHNGARAVLHKSFGILRFIVCSHIVFGRT